MATDTLPSAVVVVGAGTMGHGLALQFARHGAGVALVDHRESNLADARTGVDDGAGFHDYDASPTDVRRRRDERVAAIRRALD
jgi:3-hydroxybutyryl-CoA dehydrogenase